jgi:hypothetical protein
VEGFPETGRPLDPEPGLGGISKCRPVSPESKLYFRFAFRFVTSITDASPNLRQRVDLAKSGLIEKEVLFKRYRI